MENIDPKVLSEMSDEELSELLQQARTVSSLPYIATAKQLEFHEHPARNAEVVLYGGSLGGGKSAALCAEAIRECREVPGNKVLLARKELVTFKRTTLVELLRLIENIPEKTVHRITEQRFLFPNGSELHYGGLGTEKDREKLKGLELGMLGIDEASEVDKPTFQTAAARVRHKPAKKVNRLKIRITSNPEPGWIKEDFIDNPRQDLKGNALYHFIPATIKDNPHISEDYELQLRQMFAGNPEWERAYIEGDWNAFSGTNQVIPSHWIADAVKNKIEAGFPCIWGLDVARFGDDHSVLVQRRGNKFEILKSWAKQATDITASEVINFYRAALVKPRSIYADEIGVGAGVVDILRSAGLPVIGVNVGRPSQHNSDKYFDTKAELWWSFRKMMETGDIELPNDIELKTELGSIRYEFISGRVKIESKDIVKKKLGRSPDEADALVLAAWSGAESFVLFDDPKTPVKKPNVYTSDPKLVNLQREESINQLLKILERR